MIRAGVLIALVGVAALAGCSDGTREVGRHKRMVAVRAGLYAIQAAPGGALAKFDDVRLVGTTTVCGKVDGQDGAGPRRFAVAKGQVTIEQPREPATVQAIAAACANAPSYRVISRNAGYTDIAVEDDPS
ncbi:MAG TPA: hypothetical protein VFQ57_01320 [Sphingomonas sp.]|jgi:hypothetical protein|nr:hypothetical protein [Sphingomonas sp.]